MSNGSGQAYYKKNRLAVQSATDVEGSLFSIRKELPHLKLLAAENRSFLASLLEPALFVRVELAKEEA